MKKKILLFFSAAMLSVFPSLADDIEYTYEGQTLVYTVLDEDAKTVETKAGLRSEVAGNKVEGALIIPSQIEVEGVTYEVTRIGSHAFSGCYSLTSVTIPESVTEIGWGAFDECSELTSVTIPENVTAIGSSTFRHCSGLTSVTIPEGITAIGSYAFDGCSSLTSVAIPKNVTNIGSDAFKNCSGLTYADFASIEALCDIKFGNGYSNPLYYAHNLHIDGKEVTSVTIPAGITEIGEYAFDGCFGLTYAEFASIEALCSIKFGNKYSNPLYYAHNLHIDGKEVTSVTIPENVTAIRYTFAGCSGLTSVTIPENVTEIGEEAFYYCWRLTSVTIPEGVTEIGEDAFNGCGGLTYAEFASIEALCSIKFGNEYSNPLYYAHNLYIDGKEVTSVTIPNSVTEIGSYAFDGCSGLTSITIPNSVTEIGSFAFDGCSSLTSVTIPNSVTEIGRYAFNGCSALTSVTIPNSVTEIGSRAFKGCSGLVSVILCGSEIVLWDDAFDGCKNLLKCAYPDREELLPIPAKYHYRYYPETEFVENGNIYGDGGKSILFTSYKASGKYSVPSSVTEIGNSAYIYLPNLKTIEIPNDVTTIGNRAFAYCDRLQTVMLPNKLETLGSAVFEKSSKIKNVVFNGPTPVESTADVFDNKVYEDATLYVRPGRQTLFMAVSPWKYFYNITDKEYSGIEDVVAPDFDAAAPCEVYTLNGVKVADSTENLPSGIYVIRQGSKVEKRMVK